VRGDGLNELIRELRIHVEAARNEDVGPTQFVVHRPAPDGVVVEKIKDGYFEVHGREARRAVALSDLNDIDALHHAQQRLDSLRVPRALARAGAKEGDIVIIGDFQFEYEPDG
jgi:GTPase